MHRTIRYSSIITIVALAACTRSKTDQPVETTTAAGTSVSPAGTVAAVNGKSLVRFVNSLPAPKGVDLKVNEGFLFQNVAPKVVTAYAEVATDAPKFALHGAGKDSTMAENKEVLVDGRRYTAVALTKADGTSELRVWRDDLVPDAGKARIRVIHAAPGLDDVRIGIAGSDTPLFNSVSYATEAGFKDVDPSDPVLIISRSAKGAQPIKLKAMHLETGHAYTIVLITKKGNLDVITFEDAGQGTAK